MRDEEFVLSIDVGGTKILVGAVDVGGHILWEKHFPMRNDDADTIEMSVMTAIDDMLASLKVRPMGVGMGLVGSVNSKDGIWNGAINIPLSRPVKIAERIWEKHRLHARIDNDVHAAALAEARLGAYSTSELALYINIGTGISSAIFSQGRVMHGVGNYAGEMGHMVVGGPDHICKCGRRGCIEPFVSGGGLVDRMRELVQLHKECILSTRTEQRDFSAGEIFEAACNGDHTALELVEISHRLLVCATVNIVNFINPEWIVLGGGALDTPWICRDFERLVRREVLPVSEKSLKGIRISSLDPKKVGLLGAGCIYYEYLAKGRNK